MSLYFWLSAIIPVWSFWFMVVPRRKYVTMRLPATSLCFPHVSRIAILALFWPCDDVTRSTRNGGVLLQSISGNCKKFPLSVIKVSDVASSFFWQNIPISIKYKQAEANTTIKNKIILNLFEAIWKKQKQMVHWKIILLLCIPNSVLLLGDLRVFSLLWDSAECSLSPNKINIRTPTDVKGIHADTPDPSHTLCLQHDIGIWLSELHCQELSHQLVLQECIPKERTLQHWL